MTVSLVVEIDHQKVDEEKEDFDLMKDFIENEQGV